MMSEVGVHCGCTYRDRVTIVADGDLRLTSATFGVRCRRLWGRRLWGRRLWGRRLRRYWGDLRLTSATFGVRCREGYRYGGQQGNHYHHHGAKNRDAAVHTNHISLGRWARAISLGSIITAKSPLRALWFTLARTSVSTRSTPRICQMAYFSKLQGQTMA